jgi:hypothetical protein
MLKIGPGWSDNLHLACLGFRHVREISALEKAERGNIFAADTRSVGPLCFLNLKNMIIGSYVLSRAINILMTMSDFG